MASIFTYDPDPPRVSSPWPGTVLPSPSEIAKSPGHGKCIAEITECGINKLEAEPQEGPVEYKLHLLLRPRRKLLTSTTVLSVSGSNQSRTREPSLAAAAKSITAQPRKLPVPTSQARQIRLQNLTTQLLWRLQQSSPHHSSSKSDLVVPTFVDGNEKPISSIGPAKLHPGLEQSQGALYEIGVSDDGAFVGLIRDELDESISTLRLMANSLGCRVEVLREVKVGKCQWTEEVQGPKFVTRTPRDDVLWVAEALILPNLRPIEQELALATSVAERAEEVVPGASRGYKPDKRPRSEQLRIALIGSTTSGKSSLLGVLSTSALDDGRGKVRKSLHKHLHEIASGITSSLVTEIIGYQDRPDNHRTEVINFASDSVSQWTDIHELCHGGRLVVATDSAGHLKYRRTTVRGLLSWAPHWTLCCIAANNEPPRNGPPSHSAEGTDSFANTSDSVSNTSKVHLELCLKLGLPLVVVITKLDLTGNASLRPIIGEILTCLKAAGRQTVPMFAQARNEDDSQLGDLLSSDLSQAQAVFAKRAIEAVTNVVPIVLTSAVTGAGIRKLHSLLRHLPIPSEPDINFQKTLDCDSVRAAGLFHIDEVFTTSDTRSIALLDGSKVLDGHVISGRLLYESTALGDTWFIGPFGGGVPLTSRNEGNRIYQAKSCPTLVQTSNGSTPPQGSARVASANLTAASKQAGKPYTKGRAWRKVKVVSLRNLKLPVRQLDPGQTGTIGIIYDDSVQDEYHFKSALDGRIRKGMVMFRNQDVVDEQRIQACQGFIALFPQGDERMMVTGSFVKVYIASIRASAKVRAVKYAHGNVPSNTDQTLENAINIRGSSGAKPAVPATSTMQVEIEMEFQGPFEWFELGSQVLVMPECGDSSNGGLDGHVGKIIKAL